MVDGQAGPMGRCMGQCMGGGMCILPGLVMLGLGVGSCLGGDSEEVVGVVSCTKPCTAQLARQPNLKSGSW